MILSSTPLRLRRRSATPLRVVVVVAHPRPDSYTHAVADAAVSGLRTGGHSVEVVDLYGEGFRPAMNVEERRGYPTGDCLLDDQARAHAELIRWCDTLVFVYPTWWSGLPAILKGWLERIFVVGVAFNFHQRTGKVRPGLTRMRHIVGISTYGSRRSYVAAINDNGRRILHRALRMSCGVRTRRTWLGLYSVDTSSHADRAEFLRTVEMRMTHLGDGRRARRRAGAA
jgi:NAD(P)H dehydrogenase (quinone)